MVPALRLLILVAASVALLGLLSAGVRQEAVRQEIPIQRFHGLAASTVVPVYPPTSLQHGTAGVAVARLSVDSLGRVSNVEVLEAPDEAIKASLEAALVAWRFPSTPTREGSAMQGRVVWYFVIDNGRGLVLTPTEMVGRTAGTSPTAPRDALRANR
jgi:hypothetical protein